MVLMFSSSVISSLLGLSSLEVDLLLSLSYGITSWCQVRLITSAKWARSKLIDRMGQLTRFSSCLRYPVCPTPSPNYIVTSSDHQTSIPRPKLQFRSSPRIPRQPRLSPTRCNPRIHRNLLTRYPPQVRFTTTIRFLA
jgi:hypothetical protein